MVREMVGVDRVKMFHRYKLINDGPRNGPRIYRNLSKMVHEWLALNGVGSWNGSV